LALTDEDVSEILRLSAASAPRVLTIETPSFSLHVNRSAAAPGRDRLAAPAPIDPEPAAAPPPHSPATPAPGAAEIEAPMLGTFYRTESPAHPPFVEVGDAVAPDTVVCLIEVMKLMNHIQAGVAGTIVEVLARSGELVEFGQPLFRVAPAGE
jgi:acetyl-CoA carboxylase biotin carboxyl carrier protein